jgi:hypothetical protein
MVIWIRPVMDTTRRGIWSSKHYLIVANVSILLNVMLIFRRVLTKTVKNPILVNWILHRRNESEHYCPDSPYCCLAGPEIPGESVAQI